MANHHPTAVPFSCLLLPSTIETSDYSLICRLAVAIAAGGLTVPLRVEPRDQGFLVAERSADLFLAIEYLIDHEVSVYTAAGCRYARQAFATVPVLVDAHEEVWS